MQAMAPSSVLQHFGFGCRECVDNILQSHGEEYFQAYFYYIFSKSVGKHIASLTKANDHHLPDTARKVKCSSQLQSEAELQS